MTWPLVRLIPKKTQFKFVRFAGVAALVSALLMAASIYLLATKGLNLGVDFKGGNLLEISTPGPIDIPRLRAAMQSGGVDEAQVQDFGAPNVGLIRFETPEGETTAAVVAHAKQVALKALPNATIVREETVGSKVSKELFTGGLVALLAAIGLQMLYVWFRFEWTFGFGAVAALVHDGILTLGFLSLTGLTFDLVMVASLLTILGYSMNDTVVVYDRLRENLRKYKTTKVSDLIDLSTNETLTRTLMTSITIMLALVVMLNYGGQALYGFAATMLFGMIVGTYSSIFVASPAILLLGSGKLRESGPDKEKVVDNRP